MLNNTPLSAAINALEAIEKDQTAVFRELIVVELFPKQAEEPRNLAEVMNRVTQLSLASKLNLDKALFARKDPAEQAGNAPARATGQRPGENLPTVTSLEEMNKLNPGDVFLTPDGKRWVR